MIYDYDLVVIGDSPEAEFAAERAGRLRSRVAWVTQVPSDKTNDPDQGDNPALRAEVMLEVLRRGVAHLRSGETVADPQALWEKARSYAAIAVAEREPQRLQQVGVDVIEGFGRFETRPRLQLNVEGHLGLRELRSRNYLLAPSAKPCAPTGEIKSEIRESVYDWIDWELLPRHVVIFSQAAEELLLSLAQLLNRLGCQVQLLLADTGLLPSWDRELSEQVTGVLRAEGIDLQLCDVGDALASAQSSIAPGNSQARLITSFGVQPQWQDLNLEALGLSASKRLDVTPKLRTEHPHVYACGAATLPCRPGRNAIAQHQATIALRNALWWPWWQSREETIVKTLDILPSLAQVGLMDYQARKQYGEEQVTVVLADAQNNAGCQWRDQPLGLCKLVVHRKGRLLGAQAWAAGAEDWMEIAAQVIQQKGSVKDLEKLALPRYSAASLLHQAAAQWRWDRLSETPRREDLIERFFNWRRTGSV